MRGLKTTRLLMAGLLFVFLIASGGLAHAYTAILSFGDSLSDNGRVDTNGIAGDYYGIQRFSNGPVWVEYLAGSSHFNAPLMDLAYGGATTGWDNPAMSSATGNSAFDTNTGLLWQVATYTATFHAIAPTALITVWAGGNDMFNDTDAVPYTAASAANKAAGLYSPANAALNIETAIQSLISIGGRSFIVPNLGYSGFIASGTSSEAAWVQSFDSDLASDLTALRLTNPGVSIYGLDLQNLITPSDWIPSSEGTFLNPNGHAGTFVSWDGIHPTTEAHALIADYAASAVPIPTPLMLMFSGIAALVGLKKRIKI